MLDFIDRRELARVLDTQNLTVCLHDFVGYGRSRGDEIEVKFALQTLLDNLHVQ